MMKVSAGARCVFSLFHFEAADVLKLIVQTVRVVILAMSVFAVVYGLSLLFDEDPFNNAEGVFSVLIFTLLAIAMGASFWTVMRRRENEVAPISPSGNEDVRVVGRSMSSQPFVLESARIVPTRRRWAAAGFGSSTTEKAELTVDGTSSAHITTGFKVNHEFDGIKLLRETRAVFGAGGPEWRIRAVPRQPEEVQRFGITERPPGEDRILVVESRKRQSEPFSELFAETTTSFGGRHTPFLIQAKGEEYELSPASKATSGRIIGHGLIERAGFLWWSYWSIKTKQQTPLSVVLAHWHLLIGDTQHTNSGGSIGGG